MPDAPRPTYGTMSNVSHVLVVGGQRSGKSRFAEDLIARSRKRPVYVATATARDDEMRERIATHRARRGVEWTTIEEALELSTALDRAGKRDSAVLIDCLTVWLANLMEAGRDVDAEVDRLSASLAGTEASVVLVSNEVGAGIIPANALARRYADALGTLNQRIALAVGRVILMTAGQPVIVKPAQTPEIVL